MKIRHYITDRYHPLPENYVPEDLVRAPVPFVAPIHDMKRCISMVAYEPLRKLFNACFKEGFDLMGVSAFRSYSRQKEIFDESVKTGAGNIQLPVLLIRNKRTPDWSCD